MRSSVQGSVFSIVPIASVLLAALSLVGCAEMPTSPSVMALPGTGRSFDAFRADDTDCRRYASQVVGTAPGPNDAAVRSAAVGTAVGAVAGAAIGGRQGAGIGAGTGLLVGSVSGADAGQRATYGSQRQYDHAYIQCMYGRGHKVPVSAEFARTLQQGSTRGGAVAPGGNIPPPPPYSPPGAPPPDYVPAR